MKDGSKLLFAYHKTIANVRSKMVGSGMVSKPDWSNINVVIFVSTGRTGTHFMSHFFNENFEKTYGVHEPDTNIYDLNINYLFGKIGNNETLKTLDLFRKDVRSLIEQKGASNYIESNLELSFLIPVLRDYFPNLKIVHVVRNAKDVVRSYYSREAYGKWVGWVPFMSEKDPRDRLNAKIFKDDPYFSKWDSMDRFDKICWYYSKYNQLIESNLEGYSNSIRVSFEDLFKNKNLDVWSKLIDFSGMKPFQKEGLDIIKYMADSRSNDVKKFKIGKYADWSNEQKNTFKNLCGESMNRYGYEI